MSKLYPVLSNLNKHHKDNYVHFEESCHKYTILSDPDSLYTSVTTWNHLHFPKFNANMIIKSMMNGKNWKEGHKYWGKTSDEIKQLWSNNGSNEGTNLHFEIECFMNNPIISCPYTNKDLYENSILCKNNSVEWQYFTNFLQDFPNLKPYRTEWVIYDEELKIAGSIDMVYENEDNTLSIYDWKRSKDITKINKYNKFAITKCISQYPDSNFWHYALQLNTYKAIIEKNYGKKIKELYLVRLHPDAEEKNYELIEVVDMQESIKELFELRKIELETKEIKETKK